MGYEEDMKRREAARERLRARQERTAAAAAQNGTSRTNGRSRDNGASNSSGKTDRKARSLDSGTAFHTMASPITTWRKNRWPVNPIVMIVAGVIVLIVIVLAVRGCTASNPGDEAPSSAASAPAGQISSSASASASTSVSTSASASASAASSAAASDSSDSSASADASDSSDSSASADSADSDDSSDSSASADSPETSDASASAEASDSASSSQTAPATAQNIRNAKALAEASTPVQAIALAAPEVDETPIYEDVLANLMGWELTNKLLARAQKDIDAHWIASHPEEYLEDGSMVQYKLLRLAANEGDAIPFVRNWPELYCADAPNYDAPSATNRVSNGVPLLLQWDERWGYTEYSGTTFALTACCPTTLAMIYQGVTGKTDKTPYDMGALANRDGYMSELNGTGVEFLTGEAETLGMSCIQIDALQSSVEWALGEGMIIACNVGPGDFTDGGHYFVITGITKNGELEINDPFSVERSSRTWPADTVLSQTMGLYAFSKL